MARSVAPVAQPSPSRVRIRRRRSPGPGRKQSVCVLVTVVAGTRPAGSWWPDPRVLRPRRRTSTSRAAAFLAANGLLPSESLLHPFVKHAAALSQTSRPATPGTAQPDAQPPDLSRPAAQPLLTPGRWNAPAAPSHPAHHCSGPADH